MTDARLDHLQGTMRVERCARMAYSIARVDPICPEGPAALLRRMMGHPAAIDQVDGGVAPERCVLEYGPLCGPGEGGLGPVCARVLASQRAEQLTLACASACALFVAWTRCETWDDAMTRAVALSITLPTSALEMAIADGVSAEEIAWSHVVDSFVVHQRLRMMRGGHNSGERPALRLVL